MDGQRTISAKHKRPICLFKLGVSGFGQFWVREIGVKKVLV